MAQEIALAPQTSTAGVSKATPGALSVLFKTFSIVVHPKRVETTQPDGKKALEIVPAGIDIPAEMTRADLGKVLMMIGEANRPPSRAHIGELITRLYMVTSHRTATNLDLSAMIRFFYEDLKAFPADVLEVVLRADRQWFPSLSELKAEAANHHLPRRYMAKKINDRLARMPTEGHSPPMSQPTRKRTAEQIEADEVAERASAERHESNMKHFTKGIGKAIPKIGEFTKELKAICKDRCAEKGDPPCFDLPNLTSPCEHITPCADCLDQANG